MNNFSSNPLFCVRTKDKKSGEEFFINFKTTDKIGAPTLDFDEEQLVKVFNDPRPTPEGYMIPFALTPLFWSKEEANKKRHFVIDAAINDKFAIRRVLDHDVIRRYVILVVMSEIQDKFNHPGGAKVSTITGADRIQFIGHDIELDQWYEILVGTQSKERTDELVNNKVVIVDAKNSPESIKASKAEESGDEPIYDLFYRPATKILTCSINTERLPDSISFNADRIVVKLGDKSLMDVCLPFFIDLKQEMKYKFDDRLCLLRVVFKIVEAL